MTTFAEMLKTAYLLLLCKQCMKFLQLINHLYRHGYKSLYPVISSDIYSLSDYNLAENVMLGALCGNGEIIYKIKSNKIWHLKIEIFPSKHSLIPFPSFIFLHKPYCFLTGYLFYILSFFVCVLMLKAGIFVILFTAKLPMNRTVSHIQQGVP